MRGATFSASVTHLQLLGISTHAPLAGRDEEWRSNIAGRRRISTHAPLAGRDGQNSRHKVGRRYFNPRAPCGARLRDAAERQGVSVFQPTRPLRGATQALRAIFALTAISTHAPLAGRDRQLNKLSRAIIDFNPRAPCGARRQSYHKYYHLYTISTHAPLAGRDRNFLCQRQRGERFQPTRPLRGATSAKRLFHQ